MTTDHSGDAALAPTSADAGGAPWDGNHQVARPLVPFSSATERISALLLVLFVETVLVSVWLDTSQIASRSTLTRALADWAPTLVRLGVAFVVAALIFADGALRWGPRPVWLDTSARRFSWRWMAVHLASLACLLAFVPRVLATADSRDAWVASWLACALLVGVSAACLFVPVGSWLLFVRARWRGLGIALAAGALVCLLGVLATHLWEPLRQATFFAVQLVLAGLIRPLVVDAAHATIGSPKFSVEIAPECSGLEGVGLGIALAAIVLVAFRSQFRFPRALLLLPLAALSMWLLNIARIAALILIGDAGYPQIAEGGFHSQAGWIAFNLVAFGLVSIARRSQFFAGCDEPAESEEFINPTLPYLAPFLAIVAAGMLSQALSAQFETWYALRPLAAVVAMFWFRDELASLDWKFGRQGVTWGVIALVAWWMLLPPGESTTEHAMTDGLAGLSPVGRAVWIVCRAASAVIIVPLAEELAFRGFVLRRLMAADFDRVDPRGASWLAIGSSSLAFGVLHGAHWLPATAAGICYALAIISRGRLGDAVIAHVTTNGLLMAWVLVTGRWDAW